MPNQQPAQFDLNTVRVNYQFSLPQVDLIVKGLNSLTVGEAADFRAQFIGHAQATVQHAKQGFEQLQQRATAEAAASAEAAPAEVTH